MKTDLQIKTDVGTELAWDPSVSAANIGVAVKNGVVTLSGTVDTYLQKQAAERAARRVSGVRGIALDIEVRLGPDHSRSDAEIAEAALYALAWHSLVPEETVQVKVENGWVTLTGQVQYPYQAASAEQAVRPLVGVRGVSNEIRLVARADAQQIRSGILDALVRHAEREAGHITVEVEDSVVTLRGQVDSLLERDAVVGTAKAAKGVTRVVDALDVLS